MTADIRNPEDDPSQPLTPQDRAPELSEAAILRATSDDARSKTPTQDDKQAATCSAHDYDEDADDYDGHDDVTPLAQAHLERKSSRGLSNFLSRRRSHQRGQRREKVRMVGQHLQEHIHSAFKGWFRDTESDGSPILPSPLSKKYNVTTKVLGQGSFAVVKAVTEKATGEERALKIIAKKPLKENSEKMLKEEIKILGAVEHPHVIKMWDLYETKEAVFIVTDLCRGGELFDRLVEKVHYNELDARHIVKQIFDGVRYLHQHDIIHRDLKPENILLRDKDEPSNIVISDFGLSRFIPEEGLLMTACGSPQYVSPEVLLGRGYGPAVDIWSSGVIAYCLLAGYTPFYGEDQPTLFQEIVKMKVEFEPQYWSDISATAKDFILRCLCPTEERMTADQALAHPWLADLPPPHAEEHRGACLKEKAKKHLTARQKVANAVTAVEAINYLQRLHSLRQEHAHDLSPDELSRLLRAATHLHISSTRDDLEHQTVAAKEEIETSLEQSPSTATITKNSDIDTRIDPPGTPRRKADSAMSIDLVVMPSFGERTGAEGVPRRGVPGTAAMAAQIEASGGGMSEAPSRAMRSSSTASTVRPSSPGAESVSSDATAMPSSDDKPKPKPKRSGFSSALTSLLDQYRGETIPETARTDPAAQTKEREPMTITKAWQYVPFLLTQGYTIGSAVASHALYGPPKKSWGVEMSVFTRLLRQTAAYTQFATVDGMQKFFELASFLPVPKDGLITPVTFRVKKRGLKGFLAESDAAEDGTRELTGEWVVGKQTWRRLQAEWRNGKSKGTERVILYIHGGAYFVMSAVTHRPVTISLSKYTECRVFAMNYRLAPGCKFPGQLHDVVASWFRLTDDLGIPADNIVLAADSAGGGLACALMYYLRDNKYPLPSGAILFSPWVDLTMSCDSWDTNAEYDYLSVPASHDHMNPVRAYLGDNLDKYLTHPYASPLFGDMKGLPPLLIQCGDAEVLRDEVTLLAHKASLAGVPVRHELYEDCVHVFQAFLFLDASRKALQSARHFVRTALDKRERGKRQRRTEVTRDTRRQMDEEMRENMGNSRGEKVEPRTGTRRGDWREGRPESDTELEVGSTGAGSRGGEDEEDDASDEEWELHRRGSQDLSTAAGSKAATAARKAQPARLAAEAMGVGDSAVTEMERGDLPPRAAGGSSSSTSSASASPLLKKATNSRASAHSPSSSSSSSLGLSMSLEEARLRAQAGMRAQESPSAPHLGKFHDPTRGNVEHSLRPRIRSSKSGRTTAANAAAATATATLGASSEGGLSTSAPSLRAGAGAGAGDAAAAESPTASTAGAPSASAGTADGGRGDAEAQEKLRELMAEFERDVLEGEGEDEGDGEGEGEGEEDPEEGEAATAAAGGDAEPGKGKAKSKAKGKGRGKGKGKGKGKSKSGFQTMVFTPQAR